ncbi:MAG: hypothetical protein K5683_00235 [Prevotella sp.]|nr:hypothetical protein [Prevotella sp.]
MMVVVTMLAACGGQKSPQAGGHGIGIDSTPAAQIDAEDTDYVPQRADYSFRSDVRTITDDGEVLWDTIIVYLTDAKGHTQELYGQAQPLDTLQWDKTSIGEILEDDWNFDGIPDLQVCTGPTNGFGNYTYDVWLWNDQVHKFEELKYDCEIYSPSIDSDNKRIVSVWRLDDDVEIIRYKWKDGKLIESDREQISASDLAE